jgi:hypothetical protein
MTIPASATGLRVPAQPLISTSAACLAGIAFVGLALRFGLSGGPLGNDEVWSLANLRGIGPFWRILWGISHDNNHFLNSLWLYFVWPWSHNPTLLRLVSILAGGLAIPVMARLGARRGPEAALAASSLTALSFFQITFSLQARGYATATLGLIFAYAAMEQALAAPNPTARRWLCAGAGLAFFSHLASGPIVAVFALIALVEAWRGGRGLGGAVRFTFWLFWPAALAMLPTLAFVIAGYIEMGGFTIGFSHGFGAAHTLSALANLEMTTLGLNPDHFPEILFAVTALPLMLLAAIGLGAPPERRVAYLTMLVVLPVAVLVLQLPNTHAARYFFALSPFLLLLFADTFSAGWRLGGGPRLIVALALAAFAVGNGAALARLYAGEQAPWTEALDRVAASGDLTIASSFDFNVGRTIAHYNLDRASPLDHIPSSDLCARRPGWYVQEFAGNEQPDAALPVKGEGCKISYVLQGVYARNTPWQAEWGLYRRADLVR